MNTIRNVRAALLLLLVLSIGGSQLPAAQTDGESVDATGLWEAVPASRQAMVEAGEQMRGRCIEAVLAEVRDCLNRLGLFAAQVKIAQTDDGVTIVGGRNAHLTVALGRPTALVGEAAAQPGRRAFVLSGALHVEQRGHLATVSAVYARVPDSPFLVQAVKVDPRDGERPLVIKQVLQPSQNRERLPNPWKEPPSILPPPEKRRGSVLQRGAQQLMGLTSALVPFL